MSKLLVTEEEMTRAYVKALKEAYPKALIVGPIRHGSVPSFNDFYPPEYHARVSKIEGKSAEQLAKALVDDAGRHEEYALASPRFISYRQVEVHPGFEEEPKADSCVYVCVSMVA